MNPPLTPYSRITRQKSGRSEKYPAGSPEENRGTSFPDDEKGGNDNRNR
jgi:hypothetical protein